MKLSPEFLRNIFFIPRQLSCCSARPDKRNPGDTRKVPSDKLVLFPNPAHAADEDRADGIAFFEHLPSHCRKTLVKSLAPRGVGA